MPLIAAFGPWPMLAATSLIMLFWLGLGLALFGKKNVKPVDRLAPVRKQTNPSALALHYK
ncbi:hypothetical protein D3C87_2208320 [compost metagenome]